LAENDQNRLTRLEEQRDEGINHHQLDGANWISKKFHHPHHYSQQLANKSSITNSSADTVPSEDEQSSIISDGSNSSVVSSSCSSSSNGQSANTKSPSLHSLRQSLLWFRPSRKTFSSGSSPHSRSLVPTCVRSRQSSGSDTEEVNDQQKGTTAYQNSLEQKSIRIKPGEENNGNAPTMTTTSCLRLTEFTPIATKEKHEGKIQKEKGLDAVEEAIRSLEQFR
jgi:hypothetical protein